MKKKSLSGEERVLPGAWLPPWTLLEHEARYVFSAQYVANKIVVDCACGNGVGAEIFLKQYPFQYYGFDLDQNSIDFSAQHLPGKNVVFEKADALALPLENETADIFISLETIEHIKEDRLFLKEAARVLKPNGLLILSTPNRLVTNPGALITDSPWNQFHIREYSAPELAALLEDEFSIEAWFGQNPNSSQKIFVMDLLSRIFGKRLTVRLNQLWKCRWICFPNKKFHDVIMSRNSRCDEYLVVLCRRKS